MTTSMRVNRGTRAGRTAHEHERAHVSGSQLLLLLLLLACLKRAREPLPCTSKAMASKQLLQGFALGSLQLSNRVVLAPLTRGRSGDSRVPNDINADYYAQRASAGLLITEATAVSEQGYGWCGAPGVYTDEQQVTACSRACFAS